MTLRVDPARIVAESANPLLQIASGWGRVPLGDIAEIVNGFAFPSANFSRHEGMPLIRIRDIAHDSTEAYYGGSYDPRYLVRSGALLIGMDGDFNVSEWSGPDGLLNQRVCRVAVRDDADYSQRFLRWVLPAYLAEIHTHTSAVTVKHLSSVTVGQLPIPRPPRAAQDRIVSAIEEEFSRIDAGTAALARSGARLGSLRRSALSSIISSDPLEAIRSGWRTCTLGTLGTLDRGKSRHRPRNDPSLYGGRYPFVQTGDVTRADPWIDSFSQTYNDQGLAQSRLWPSGTLCITIAANIGKTGLLTFDACFPDSVVGFVASDGHLVTRWVDLVLRSLQHELEAMAPATAQKNINLAVLRRLPIPVPPAEYLEQSIEEFDRIHSRVGSLQKVIAAGNTKARRLRDAVLAAAFQGRLTGQPC